MRTGRLRTDLYAVMRPILIVAQGRWLYNQSVLYQDQLRCEDLVPQVGQFSFRGPKEHRPRDEVYLKMSMSRGTILPYGTRFDRGLVGELGPAALASLQKLRVSNPLVGQLCGPTVANDGGGLIRVLKDKEQV